MALLDSEETKRVEAAIAAVEARSAGEVVVATVARSDAHSGDRVIAAALAACALAALLNMLWPGLPAVYLLLLQLPLALLLWTLFGLPALLRLVVPGERLSGVVQERATQMFLERGIFETRDRTGVLILVSALERRAVILGDKGIHARVQMDGWKKYADQIAAAVAAGRTGAGLVDVIEEIGALLGDKVPVREGDTDELSNKIVTE